MLSLKEICILKIINENIPYNYHKIPTDLIDDIAINEIKYRCGTIVTDKIKSENNGNIPDWEYYFNDLPPITSVLNDKDYVMTNIKSYLVSYKRMFYQHSFPRRDYIIYYLKQESDFIKIYPQKSNIKIDDLIKYLNNQKYKCLKCHKILNLMQRNDHLKICNICL